MPEAAQEFATGEKDNSMAAANAESVGEQAAQQQSEYEEAQKFDYENLEQQDATWYWSEGLEGEGDKPEWFKGNKYKSIADQAKAYTELEKRFGQSGAPEKYNMEVLEKYGLEIDNESGLAQEWQDKAHELRFSQEAFDVMMDFYAQDLISRLPQARDEIINEVGEQTYQRVSNWVSNSLTPDEVKILDGIVGSTDVVRILDKLRASSQPSQAMGVQEQSQKYGIKIDSKERIEQEVADNWQKYQNDRTYRDQIAERLARVMGG